MDSKTFWAYVDTKKAALLAAHLERRLEFQATGNPAAWQGQPQDGHHVFIVSKENLEKAVTPGRVSEAPVRLAAQRMIEQTHDLANASQIAEHIATQLDNREAYRKIEQDRKQPFNVILPPQPPQEAQRVDTSSPAFQLALERAVTEILAKLAPAGQAPASSNEKAAATKLVVPLKEASK